MKAVSVAATSPAAVAMPRVAEFSMMAAKKPIKKKVRRGYAAVGFEAVLRRVPARRFICEAVLLTSRLVPLVLPRRW